MPKFSFECVAARAVVRVATAWGQMKGSARQWGVNVLGGLKVLNTLKKKKKGGGVGGPPLEDFEKLDTLKYIFTLF